MKDLFLDCGLTTTESAVLVCLLQYGPREAGILARRLDMKRPTVYSALSSLEKKQLVSRQTRDRRTIFSGLAPSKIPAVMLNQAKREFSKLKDSIEMVVPRLNEFPESSAAKVGSFEIQVLEGEDPYETIVQEHLLSKPFYAIWNPQIGVYNERMKKRIAKLVHDLKNSGNCVREIVVAGPTTSWYKNLINNPKHQLRVISRELKTMADCILVDGSVFFTINVPDQETAIQITNNDHYCFMLGVFDELWNRIGPKD